MRSHTVYRNFKAILKLGGAAERQLLQLGDGCYCWAEQKGPRTTTAIVWKTEYDLLRHR